MSLNTHNFGENGPSIFLLTQTIIYYNSYTSFADVTDLKYYESSSDEFEDLVLLFLCFLFLCGGDGDLSDSELSDDEELEPLDELDDELEELSDDEDSLSLVFL